MFIDDSDIIEIKVHYIKSGHRYEAKTEKEFQALDSEDEKKLYAVLNVKMALLSWGLYNQLQEDAMTQNISGETQFNFKVYKENRLKKLVKGWDAKGKDDKDVPVSDKAISHLAPSIAETILRAYDEESFVGDEEEKK